MTVGVSGPWTPFATLSASMARTRRQNCQIGLYARRDPPAQEGDISALEKRGHYCFALTVKTEYVVSAFKCCYSVHCVCQLSYVIPTWRHRAVLA